MQLRPTTFADVEALARTMRPADALEVQALGLTPLRAVQASWERADYATTLLVAGQVAAIGGLELEPPGSGLALRAAQAWLLTGAALELGPMALHRAAKAWLAESRAVTDVLWNRVDARYAASLRWLQALGWQVHPPRPHGPAELPFHLVTWEA